MRLSFREGREAEDGIDSRSGGGVKKECLPHLPAARGRRILLGKRTRTRINFFLKKRDLVGIERLYRGKEVWEHRGERPVIFMPMQMKRRPRGERAKRGEGGELFYPEKGDLQERRKQRKPKRGRGGNLNSFSRGVCCYSRTWITFVRRVLSINLLIGRSGEKRRVRPEKRITSN